MEMKNNLANSRINNNGNSFEKLDLERIEEESINKSDSSID